MARKQARVDLNRSKLLEVQRIVADGLLHFGHEIALEASSRAADAPPYGEGLVNAWGVAAYVDGKKVGDVSGDGKAVAKPRGVRLAKGLQMLVGFGFPARFLEFGTVDTRAQPFLTPAVLAMQSRSREIIAEVTVPALKAMP